ncbi:MAG: TonB-dependent receptor [Flavobacteriales bacterium]|nr:TonB-dependent receptor [Flavobacteriales bacterium]
MKHFWSLALLFTAFTFLKSKGQEVSGRISDKLTNETLIGVNILLDGKGVASSDFDGNFSVVTSEGVHEMVFKFIGYKEEKIKFTLSAGESKRIEIEMSEDAELIETVVVSAGKFEQRIEETTVSIEVIKPNLISNKNTTNIQTAIDQVPGVNITDGQANIRGGSGWSYGAGTRVQVLVDDMPLISGDAGQAQWSLISTENINQVEIIKGATSALYGSSALNGVINIRTAYPTDKPETKINFHNGKYANAKRKSLNWWGYNKRKVYGMDFLHKQKIGHLDLVLGGFFLEDQGYRYKEVTSRQRINFNTRYRNPKVEGLSYGINANFLFNETASALIWESYESAYIPLDSAVTKTSGDVYNIDPFITYVNPKSGDKHRLRTRYMRVINDNETKDDPDGQDNQSTTYYAEYQYQKNLESLGINWTSGLMNEYVDAVAELFNGTNYRLNNAVFTQLDKKLGKRINLSLGARYEQFMLKTSELYEISGDSVNSFKAAKPVFRAGINYQLAEGTFLRSSWGQGYRFPSIAELFIETEVTSGIYVYQNPELKPESGWSSELAIKQGFKIGNWGGFIDIAGFIMEYENMMEFSFGQWQQTTANSLGIGFKSINIGDTRISGIEFSLSAGGKVGKNELILLGGYTYIDAIPLNPEIPYGEDINGNELNYYNTSSLDSSSLFLKYRHKHVAKLDMEYKTGNWSFGTSFRYNSFMLNVDKIFVDPFFETLVPGIPESRENLANGDFIVDTRIICELYQTTSLSLIINNLLNREYQTRPANMMAPRTVSLKFGISI